VQLTGRRGERWVSARALPQRLQLELELEALEVLGEDVSGQVFVRTIKGQRTFTQANEI
jgi:hypothetical protein